MGSVVDVEGARVEACRLGFGALAGAFSSRSEVLRVFVGRGMFGIAHKRRVTVFSRFKCFLKFSHAQTLEVAHELTASLFYAVVPSDKRIARYQVQNLFVGRRILHVGGAHLTAAATGSVDGSKGCFQIVVGKLVSLGSGGYRSRGHDCRSRLRHCAAKERQEEE